VARTTIPVGETIDKSAHVARRAVLSWNHCLAGTHHNMNLPALILLALAMSTDAFAAAIGKGASMQKPHLLQALRIGLLFGCIEAITPLIGWAIGSVAAKWVADWDHWIAFVLLLGLGARMIWAGLGKAEADPEQEQKPQQSFMLLALTAVATSIDAMAVGVGLAFIDVNILEAAALIGLATTVMVTIGVMVGRLLGSVIGQRAEIIGGVVLIGVGATILYEHLAV
jgi:putative Mn2+ efflux pump MntP